MLSVHQNEPSGSQPTPCGRTPGAGKVRRMLPSSGLTTKIRTAGGTATHNSLSRHSRPWAPVGCGCTDLGPHFTSPDPGLGNFFSVRPVCASTLTIIVANERHAVGGLVQNPEAFGSGLKSVRCGSRRMKRERYRSSNFCREGGRPRRGPQPGAREQPQFEQIAPRDHGFTCRSRAARAEARRRELRLDQ